MHQISLRLNPIHLKKLPELHEMINHKYIKVPRIPVKGDIIDVCSYLWWDVEELNNPDLISSLTQFDLYEVEKVVFRPTGVTVHLGCTGELLKRH